MAKTIQQFRYYGDTNEKNYPVGLNREALNTGKFLSDYLPVYKLGIQAAPGTSFIINNSSTNVESRVIIGLTGVYELSYDNKITVTSLFFTKDALDLVEKNEGNYILMDIIYDKEGEM